MIYCEIGQAIIKVNDVLIAYKKSVAEAGYDLNEFKLNHKNQFKLINSLAHIIRAEKVYRLSICVNKSNILFTNIQIIE